VNGNQCCFFVQVRHSQSFTATPAHCWIVCEQSGIILHAHCTCVAGLGETCSHVAATLFYLEMYSRVKGMLYYKS
jgi:hypothetical protein